MSNNVKSVHFIDNNHVQKFVTKVGEGTKEDCFHVMDYHVNTHKALKSDQLQTDGGKKLWLDYIKSRNHDFHYSDNNIKNPITKHTIQNKEKDIWGKSPKHIDLQIHAVRKDD